MPNIYLKKMSFFVIWIFISFSTPLKGNPLLLFDSAELSQLKSSVNSQEYEPIWDAIEQRAARYCNPSDELYVDPQGEYFTETQNDGWFGRRVFSWIEPIGFAYQITGNYVYGLHGAAILDAAIDCEPDGGELPRLRYMDMMRAIAFGYDWLKPAMTAQQRQRVENKAKDYIEWTVADNIPGRYYHNFMGVAYGGAGLCALAVKDVYPDLYQDWLDVCIERVSFWFENSFDPQGAYCEGHYYLQYGLANSIPFAVALNKNEGIDLLADSRLENLSNYLVWIQLPGDNVFEARNDALYSSSLEVMLKYLVGYYEDGLLEYLWQNANWVKDYKEGGYSPVRLLEAWNVDVAAQPPSLGYRQLGEHFTERGLVVFRTGWQQEDVMFSIEAGQFYHGPGGTHNQADKGHFNIYGLGKKWAVDPGYSNSRTPLERGQTIDHSCILVNGQGQAVSGGAIGTDGEIIAYEDNFFYGYTLADCKPAYNRDTKLVDKALRHAIFVKPMVNTPAYIVLIDDIHKGSEVNTYQWQMIGADNAEVVVEDFVDGIYQAKVLPDTDSDKCMDVQISAAQSVSLNSTYYNPLIGTPSQYPKIEAVCNAVNPRFITVLSPRMTDLPKPQVSVQRGQQQTVIKIQWQENFDQIVWQGDDIDFTLGNRCLYQIPADFNKDCVVDMEDLKVFASEWMQ